MSVISKVTIIVLPHKTEFTCSKTLSGKTSYCKYFKYTRLRRRKIPYLKSWATLFFYCFKLFFFGTNTPAINNERSLRPAIMTTHAHCNYDYTLTYRGKNTAAI